tara:strand:+ start:2413 stop:4461 length:2049 start_codon:yes stop_codon:yes gene_type:complete
MNSFIFKNSVFCFFIALVNALIFSYLRLNLETPPYLALKLLIIIFSILFLPNFFLRIFKKKNEKITKSFYLIFSLFVLSIVICTLLFKNTNSFMIVYYFFGLICLYELIYSFMKLKKKINLKYIIYYFFILFLISAYYFTTITNSNITSVFSPEEALLGILNRDTNFHAAISHNIQNFREISLGLDGFFKINYHYFYHLLVAALGLTLIAEPLWIMSAIQYILFIPLLIFSINYSAAFLGGFKENFLFYTTLSFALLTLSENIFTYRFSYFDSVTLPLSLIGIMASLPVIHLFNNLNFSKQKILIGVFLIFFSIFVFSNKVSSGLLYLLFIGWIFLRNYKISKELIIFGIITLAVFIFNFLNFSPMPNDYLAYDGNLFNLFYIFKVYGQFTFFSPYLFVVVYLILIKFKFKLNNSKNLYIAESLLIVSFASLLFVLLGLPQDSGVGYFIYVPLIISITLLISNLSLRNFLSIYYNNNKQTITLNKSICFFLVTIFLLIAIDKAIYFAPQKNIIKKIVNTNDKFSKNLLLKNVRSSDYVRKNIIEKKTIFDKNFQIFLDKSYYNQIRKLAKNIQKNSNVGFFIPPTNDIIWNLRDESISKYTRCNNTLHIVPSLTGYPTILGAHPLIYNCPNEAYTNNYLKNNNSKIISNKKLCNRARRMDLDMIYILDNENLNLKYNIINCE